MNISASKVHNGRMTLIDGLRGVASVSVIMVHFSGFWHSTSEHALSAFMIYIAPLGCHGVDIFFVLSGFVIAYSLKQKKIDIESYLKFVIRRSIRIDPPYWAAIGIMYFVWIVQMYFGRHIEFPTTPHLLAHLAYLQYILHYEPINVVFWTLCIEIQFYLFFALLLGAIQAIKSRTIASWVTATAFSVLFVMSVIWCDFGFDPESKEIFMPFWCEFSLGVFVWWLLEFPTPSIRLVNGVAVCLVLYSLIRAQYPLAVATCTAEIIFYFGLRNELGIRMSNGVLQFLGRISYSLYLVHVPVGIVFLGMRTRVAPGSQSIGAIFWLFAIVTSLGVATILNLTVETPCIVLAKRTDNFFSRTPTCPVAMTEQ